MEIIRYVSREDIEELKNGEVNDSAFIISRMCEDKIIYGIHDYYDKIIPIKIIIPDIDKECK